MSTAPKTGLDALLRPEDSILVLIDPHDLGIFRQPSGKRLHVWAVEGDCDPFSNRLAVSS